MSAQPAQGRSSRGSGIKKRQRRAADQRSGKATSAHGLEIASASGPTKLADGVFVVWQGVDTVELTWRPQGGKLARGRERDRLELELSDLLQATKARGATSSATRWLFETGSEEQEVFLTAKGLRGSRLCLRCESWTAVVYPPASPGPRVLFQLQNEFLGRRGVGDALSDVQTWTHQHLEPLIDDTDGGEWRISRVDLAVDVAGLCFERDDIDRFTTRATTRAHHEQPAIGRQRGRALTGFEFGRKSPHARIYNKTLQARRDEPLRLRDPRATVGVLDPHAARGIDDYRDHDVAAVLRGQQHDRPAGEQQHGDERRRAQADQHAAPDGRQRDERTPIGIERRPGQAERDERDQPPGDRRGKMNQGRFLEASALK